MTNTAYEKYFAKLYGLKASNPVIKTAIELGQGAFGGEKPWTWLRASVTLTTNSDGIIEFPDDFDGVLTMRQQDSTAGGFIQPWPEAEFDTKVPRLDNLSGSWPVVCKIYKEDDIWYGQTAPPVASKTIYVAYKKELTNVSDIPDKFMGGLNAVCHTFMVKPSDVGYNSALTGKDLVVMALWKKDRTSWQTIWQTMDDEVAASFMPWWGVWAW